MYRDENFNQLDRFCYNYRTYYEKVEKRVERTKQYNRTRRKIRRGGKFIKFWVKELIIKYKDYYLGLV